MPDVVFGWILRAACVEQFPQAMLKFERVMALSDDIVLVENVAEEVTVIQLVDDRFRNILRQSFEPVWVVPPQRDVESDDVLHLPAVDGAVSISGPRDSEAM